MTEPRPTHEDVRAMEAYDELAASEREHLAHLQEVFSRHEGLGCCDPKTLEHVFQELTITAGLLENAAEDRALVAEWAPVRAKLPDVEFTCISADINEAQQ